MPNAEIRRPRIPFILLVLCSFIVAWPAHANDYYALGLGYSRTYKQISTDPRYSQYVLIIKDTIVDTLTHNGYLVFVNHNTVKVGSLPGKRASSPISYWYERNDTVLAANALDSVGKGTTQQSNNEIAFRPHALFVLDSTDTRVGDSTWRIYTIRDTIPCFTVPTGTTFHNCQREIRLVKNIGGLFDTIAIDVSAKRIGGIYGWANYPNNRYEAWIISYNVPGVEALIKEPFRTKPSLRHKRFSIRNGTAYDLHGRLLRDTSGSFSSRILFRNADGEVGVERRVVVR